jgi:hypothetical protein
MPTHELPGFTDGYTRAYNADNQWIGCNDAQGVLHGASLFQYDDHGNPLRACPKVHAFASRCLFSPGVVANFTFISP